MSLDIEKKIENIEELVEENNKMLHKIRRREIFNFWFGLIKLMILLGVFYYGYKFIEPYLQQLMSMYASIVETADSVNQIKGTVSAPGIDLGDLLKRISEK